MCIRDRIIYICRKYHGTIKRQEEEVEELKFFDVADIRELLMELKKQGKLILLASHNPADIELLCDEVYKEKV